MGDRVLQLLLTSVLPLADSLVPLANWPLDLTALVSHSNGFPLTGVTDVEAFALTPDVDAEDEEVDAVGEEEGTGDLGAKLGCPFSLSVVVLPANLPVEVEWAFACFDEVGVKPK